MMQCPWTELYGKSVDFAQEPVIDHMIDAWDEAVQKRRHAPCLHYFDATLSYDEVDQLAATLAAALADRSVSVGDRIGIFLQNDPQWFVAMLAAWRIGAIPVTVSPMLKGRELVHLLNDAGITVLLCLESLYRDVAKEVLDQTSVKWTITTHPTDLTRSVTVPVRLGRSIGEIQACPGTVELRSLLAVPRSRPQRVASHSVAVLTYTSGTSGSSKGAMNTHRGLAFSSKVYVDWFQLGDGDVILGAAPLFHITGVVAGVAASILSGAPLVLGHRFETNVVRELIERWRCTFTVATITAYIALAVDKSDGRNFDLSSLKKVASGGAAISPASAARIHHALGLNIVPVYGMTELTSASHIGPVGHALPMDPQSGALSVGIPVPGVHVRIVDPDSGEPVEPEQAGEVVMSGHNVVPGYWGRPDDTAKAFKDGWFYSGDIGWMDAKGWLFIVDRKKDLINASGYKVWPREVEDVLCMHPAVREAAVVGIPDEYRGETVKAFVSLVPGAIVADTDLIKFCRENLAAYKYPRSIVVVDELPKTASGKILRRALKEPLE